MITSGYSVRTHQGDQLAGNTLPHTERVNRALWQRFRAATAAARPRSSASQVLRTCIYWYLHHSDALPARPPRLPGEQPAGSSTTEANVRIARDYWEEFTVTAGDRGGRAAVLEDFMRWYAGDTDDLPARPRARRAARRPAAATADRGLRGTKVPGPDAGPRVADLITREMDLHGDPGPVTSAAPDQATLNALASAGLPPFLAWSARRVYFAVSAAGREGVASAPRKPQDHPEPPVTTAPGRGMFAASTRQLRQAQKVTQAQLAEAAGTSQPNIARLEGGRWDGTPEIRERIAKFLGRAVEAMEQGTV